MKESDYARLRWEYETRKYEYILHLGSLLLSEYKTGNFRDEKYSEALGKLLSIDNEAGFLEFQLANARGKNRKFIEADLEVKRIYRNEHLSYIGKLFIFNFKQTGKMDYSSRDIEDCMKILHEIDNGIATLEVASLAVAPGEVLHIFRHEVPFPYSYASLGEPTYWFLPAYWYGHPDLPNLDESEYKDVLLTLLLLRTGELCLVSEYERIFLIPLPNIREIIIKTSTKEYQEATTFHADTRDFRYGWDTNYGFNNPDFKRDYSYGYDFGTSATSGAIIPGQKREITHFYLHIIFLYKGSLKSDVCFYYGRDGLAATGDETIMKKYMLEMAEALQQEAEYGQGSHNEKQPLRLSSGHSGRCPKCGFEHDDEHEFRFCPNCGNPLIDGQPDTN